MIDLTRLGVRLLSLAEAKASAGGVSIIPVLSRAECVRQLLRDYTAARRAGGSRATLLPDLKQDIAECSDEPQKPE